MLPVGILTGGLMCGVSLGKLLFQSIPVLVLAVLLVFGISRFPDGMIHGFRVFATVIRSAGTIGIALGAFSYMTGLQLLPGLTPLDEALKVVSSIGIVLLGSLPFAEILQRLLKNPLEWIGRKNRSWKERYGRIAGGNSKCTAGNRRYEADERKRNRHECSPSGMWHIYGGGTSGICARCGCSGNRTLLAGKLTGGIAGVWMAWRIMK